MTYKHPSSIVIANLFGEEKYLVLDFKTISQIFEEVPSDIEKLIHDWNLFCLDDYTVGRFMEKIRFSDKTLQLQKQRRDKFRKDVILFNESAPDFDQKTPYNSKVTLFRLSYKFSFGEFKGKTLEQVLSISPYKIEEYVQRLPYFGLTRGGIEKMKTLEPNFTFLKTTFQKLSWKYRLAPDDMKDARRSLMENDEASSESKYDGSYAHDVEGWSDDDIDDVLGGEPDTYWNID